MSSARKIAANRMNARKSCGPRTRVGKARASRNALRHGLAGFGYKNLAFFEQIEQMAKAICRGDDNPLLLEQAQLIAESEFLLRCVRAERVSVIERLRDATAIPLAKGDNSLALGKARFHESKLAYPELLKTRTVVEKLYAEHKDPEYEPLSESTKSTWNRTLPKERDEYDALWEAIPDLNRLLRYERRAWSRRKRAVREFIAIRATENWR
jgi:hypothetical protein